MEKLNFQSFVKPFLDYIDNGNFFRQPVKILYMIIGALNALLPFYLLYQLIDSGVFEFAGTGMIFGIVISWLIMLGGFVFVGILWWTRAEQFDTMAGQGDEYPVTPVFAHIVRTSGEAFGVIVGVILFLVTLVMLVFAGETGLSALNSLGDFGWASLLILPVTGFFIIVTSRFLSEQIRAIVNIAQNTKK